MNRKVFEATTNSKKSVRKPFKKKVAENPTNSNLFYCLQLTEKCSKTLQIQREVLENPTNLKKVSENPTNYN